MDIQKIISDILKQLAEDETLRNSFLSDPVKAVEKLTGLDLPDEQINAVIAGVKAKLTADDVKDAAKGALDALGGLFGKK